MIFSFRRAYIHYIDSSLFLFSNEFFLHIKYQIIFCSQKFLVIKKKTTNYFDSLNYRFYLERFFFLQIFKEYFTFL